MDGTRFDELTRVLASTVSRRTAVKASLAALLARGIPAVTGARQGACDIFASCAPDGSNRCVVLEGVEGDCVCAFRPMAKSTICDRPICASDAECSEGQFCAVGWCSDELGRCHSGCESQGGVGVCSDGTTLCKSRCVDLATSIFHCGECGHQCGFGGDQPGEICVDGQCVCPPEYTGSCGQDYCTNESMDWNNCGTCGNQCQSGQICCSGRCVSREDSERFCEFCGYLGGWPQDCLSNEICDRGLCVAHDASEQFSQPVVVVTCPAVPEIEHHYDTSDAAVYLESWETYGCVPVANGTVEAWSSDGRLISTCTIDAGICVVEGSYGDLPITLVRKDPPPDAVLQLDWGNTLDTSNVGWRMALVYVETGAASTPESSSPDSEVLQPTGDLAYSVKNGGHWDIWAYSFDTRQNTQLTSEPASDQWAPAYSHDGTRLAFLSDQADGSNQIWLMDPDGGNKRQITDWHGAESILYIGWSPDDTQLIVTLLGDDRRLVLMPSDGGAFTDFIGPSSSFAATGVKGSMVYASENGGSGSTIYLSYFYDLSQSSPYADGDTPNLTPDGMYAVVQIGDPGSRYIETYTLSPYDSAMWNIPRVGDDSNPVWIVPDHAHIAFVSANASGETIQICRIGNDFTTPIEIAPHDRVWYLSKRFAGEGGAPPVQIPAPTSESGSAGSQPPTSGLLGRVQFWAFACPGAATELSIMGPGIAADPGPPCEPLRDPQELVIAGEGGYQADIWMPTTAELPLGHYEATHVASGATLSFDLIPTEDYLNRCSGASECIYQWWITFSTDLDEIAGDSGASAQPAGTGSIEVHVADCPAGYSGPDFYNVCHDNGDAAAHWNVIITGPDDFHEILSTAQEASPGPVVAHIEGLAPGTYGVELMTKFVKAPAYVFCSPDQGATVLADQMLGDYHDPVQVPVNGQAVVCDWYHLSLG